MTRTPDGTLSDELVDLIADAGLDAVPELLPIIIKNALHTERQPHLHAAPYERTAERRGDANGFKPKTMPTQSGKITFAVPQVRAGSCYPQALEKGLRSGGRSRSRWRKCTSRAYPPARWPPLRSSYVASN